MRCPVSFIIFNTTLLIYFPCIILLFLWYLRLFEGGYFCYLPILNTLYPFFYIFFTLPVLAAAPDILLFFNISTCILSLVFYSCSLCLFLWHSRSLSNNAYVQSTVFNFRIIYSSSLRNTLPHSTSL